MIISYLGRGGIGVLRLLWVCLLLLGRHGPARLSLHAHRGVHLLLRLLRLVGWSGEGRGAHRVALSLGRLAVRTHGRLAVAGHWGTHTYRKRGEGEWGGKRG
jgi:hypothetical protein